MITSLQNNKIIQYRKLLQKKYRQLDKLFIVEGYHLVEEAKKHGLILEILTSNSDNDGTLVSDNIIKALSTTKTPQDIIAVCHFLDKKKIGNKIIYLDHLQDPGNIGSIIRLAKSFGYTDVVVPGADFYNSKIIRSSQGSIFQVNMLSSLELELLKPDYKIFGTLVKADNAIDVNQISLPDKFVLILGNEGNGMSQETINITDQNIYIPINFESLNVSNAAAILMYALRGR